MAAPKQRRVTDVTHSPEGGVRVTAIDHNDRKWVNPLGDVKSTTLRSIPKLLGIDMHQGATLDEMRLAIRRYFAEGGKDFHRDAPKLPEPDAPKERKGLSDDIPTPTPNPEGLEMLGDFGKAIGQQSERIAKQVAAGIVTEALEGLTDNLSASALKEMVEGAVLTAVDDLRPIHVHYKDRPVVEIEDHVHPIFDEVMDCLSVGENVMLVGPAGTGKSTLGEHLAKALALEFRTISCGPTLGEHAFIGFRNAMGEVVGTPYRDSHTFGGLFLIDEIDAASEDSLLVVNAGLSNSFMAFPDGNVTKHKDHVVVASANTFGTGADAQYVGRARLDAATLDRFTSITVDYDRGFELAYAKGHGADEALVKALWKLRENVEAERSEVIVSTRGIMAVAKLVAGRGWDFERAVDRRILKGANKLQRDRVMAGVAYGK